MEKEQLITFIESQVALGKLSKEELVNIANGTKGPVVASTPAVPNATYATPSLQEVATPEPVDGSSLNQSSKLTQIFYSIGAIIAIIGVIILISQNWREIGFIGRVLVTLGIAFASYVVALLMNRNEHSAFSQVLFTIAATLFPMGAYVLLNELDVRFTVQTQIWVALSFVAIFGLALYITRRNVLKLLVVGFASWAYLSFVVDMFGNISREVDLIKWAVMFLGIAYVLVGYALRGDDAVSQSDHKEKVAIRNILYGGGTLMILGVGISLGGLFDLVFIAVLFAAFYASVYLKSRAVLVFSALFLMAHILKLTSKYFINSIGWAVGLIFAGFVVIGIGYFTFYLNKKYISKK